MLFILAGVNVFNQELGFAQAIECTPGEAVNTCHTLTGAGHTYCVFDENGNTESSCQVESCFNGQNPPDCGGPAGQPATDQEFPCMNNLSLCGENTQFCENTTGGGSATIFKHGGVCDPSKGGVDTNGCIFLFDNVRSFTGPNCQDVSTQPPPAPAPAPATPVNITLCDGRVRTFDQIDAELRGANYPGPFDHSQSEIDAYNRAACPAAAPVCTPNGSCSAPAPACGTTTSGVDNCGNACNKTGLNCPPPACVSNGSCSAAAPACGTTTTGVDNCGNACSKQGSTCPLPAQLLCQPVSQVVQVNQPANFAVNDVGKPVTWSASNGSPSSGSGLTFSTVFPQAGTFNVLASANGMSSTCQVTVQQALIVSPACVPNGSCSAQTPLSCGQINQGVDNCGNPCFRQSAACPAPQGGNITNTNTSSSTSTSSSSNTNNITFGNIGVGAPQPIAVVQPVVIQPQVVQPQVAGITVTQLPKTGLPVIAWSALAFIPTGFGMRRFRKIKKDLEDEPQFIWEDRQFKAGL